MSAKQAKPITKAAKKLNAKNRQSKPKMPRSQSAAISAPVSKGHRNRVPKPKLSTRRDGICVSHREFLFDVIGTGTFSTTKKEINPGLASSFPWLCQMAPNYESYKFKRLRFEYVPTCATSETGSVYLGVEYDATDPVPTNKQTLAAWDETSYSSPWITNNHNCKASNLAKRTSYFVRNGAIPPSDDIRLYDTGYLVVATQGNATTAPIGEIWVDYEVDLVTPQLNDVALGNSLSGSFVGATFASVPVQNGNAPVKASVASGVLTLTATQPYQALLALNYDSTSGVSVTGTALLAVLSQNVGGSDPDIVIGTLNFKEAGSTAVFSPAGVITAFGIRLGQYAVSNA